MKKTLFLFIVAAVSITQSCTHKEITSPLSTTNSVQNATAASLKNSSPGNYTVKLYVENRDTSTAEFKGYVFTFKANGMLIAKVDSLTYTGKWESKDNGKELKLDIQGTPALDDVRKSWNVIKMTMVTISLKDNEGKFGDKLVFVKK